MMWPSHQDKESHLQKHPSDQCLDVSTISLTCWSMIWCHFGIARIALHNAGENNWGWWISSGKRVQRMWRLGVYCAQNPLAFYVVFWGFDCSGRGHHQLSFRNSVPTQWKRTRLDVDRKSMEKHWKLSEKPYVTITTKRLQKGTGTIWIHMVFVCFCCPLESSGEGRCLGLAAVGGGFWDPVGPTGWVNRWCQEAAGGIPFLYTAAERKMVRCRAKLVSPWFFCINVQCTVR